MKELSVGWEGVNLHRIEGQVIDRWYKYKREKSP